MEWDEAMQISPALAALMDAGEVIQVVYVHLVGGKKLVFLGPPITEEEMEEIREVTFGERVSSVMLRAVSERHKRWAVH